MIPTEAQQAVRDESELGLLVLAPAGCGKTEALAMRAAGLVTRRQVISPRRLLILTFSNKAKDNIRVRLDAHLPASVRRVSVTVANLHGLAARLIRAHGALDGISPDAVLPSSDWVSEQCRRMHLGFPETANVQRRLQSLKHDARSDAEVENALEQGGTGAADALSVERLRVAENRLTYDDLLRHAERILTNTQVADLYRQHFSAVIVDEFQDLTPQQFRVVRAIGSGRTTYAGDLAQGIFHFAGARPDDVLKLIRQDVAVEYELATSHRSSPAVLDAVNALVPLTKGTQLEAAEPGSWPHGGLAASKAFATAQDEAQGVVGLAQSLIAKMPATRVAVIARTGPRRRFVDALVADSDVEAFRWDDPILDANATAYVVSGLRRVVASALEAAPDRIEYLADLAGLDSIEEPDTRRAVTEAMAWASDHLAAGESTDALEQRLKQVSSQSLLERPGLHLLSGHIGKGQQFDWVFVVGAEDGSIPDFRAKTAELQAEEARVLSVMLSRARHGVVVTYASEVQAQSGKSYAKDPSPYLSLLEPVIFDTDQYRSWLAEADWAAIAAR